MIESREYSRQMDNTEDYDVVSQEIATRIFFRIYQCDNLINKSVTNALAKYNTTSQQWATLGALSRSQAESGMTVGELSRYLNVSRQNLTGVLSRLEKRQLIEKITDNSDSRVRVVRLTQTGVDLWAEMRPVVNRYFSDMLHGSSFDDNVAFLSHLNKLFGKLQASDTEGD